MTEKIIYIWDQKPLREGYPTPHYQQRAKFYFYPVVEMDIWLAKLKILYEALAKTVIEQDKIISEFKENGEQAEKKEQ